MFLKRTFGNREALQARFSDHQAFHVAAGGQATARVLDLSQDGNGFRGGIGHGTDAGDDSLENLPRVRVGANFDFIIDFDRSDILGRHSQLNPDFVQIDYGETGMLRVHVLP